MSRRQSSQIVVGLLMISAGTVLLLENVGLVRVDGLWRYWPVVVIAIGVGRVFDGPPQRADEGIWLIMIGAWLLLNVLDILTWRESWPLVIVAVGIRMVFRAMSRAGRPVNTLPNTTSADDRDRAEVGGPQ